MASYYRVFVNGKQVGAYSIEENAYAEGWKQYNAGNKDTYLTTPEGWLYTFDKHPDQNPQQPEPPQQAVEMDPLAITVQYIPGLPLIPYRNGVGNYEGVICHCTDNDNRGGADTPSLERAYAAEQTIHQNKAGSSFGGY